MSPATRTAREKARLEREREWLSREVAAARSLTDEDRVRILCDLLDAAAAIEATKSGEQREREERVRRELDRPGKDRYRALAERLG
jgi:hypothetical protein